MAESSKLNTNEPGAGPENPLPSEPVGPGSGPTVSAEIPPSVAANIVGGAPVAASGPPPSARPTAPEALSTVTPPAVTHAPRARRRRVSLRPHLPVRLHTFDSFRFRDYRYLWAATFLSSSGFWLQQLVVGWFAYEITRSPFLTSVAMGLDALPILFAGPLGGLVADAFDRRRLLIYAYLYQSVVTLSFASFVLLGTVAIWHMFVFILLTGLSWVITDPTRAAMLPGIVPREGLVNAFALNSMAFSVSRLAAPALGGLLLAFTDAGPPLLLVGTLQLLAVLTVLPMRLKSDSRTVLRLTTAFPQLLEGARYVATHPVLGGLFLVAIIPSLLVMPFVHGLMPVYAAEVFDVGPTGLGLLLTAIGIGSTAGAFLLATWAKFRRPGRAVLISIAVMAVAMIALSGSPLYITALPIVVVLSAGMMMFFSVTSAAIQSVVRNDYRGRVSGLYMVTWGLFPLGSLTAGALAQAFGAPMATLLSGGVVLLALTGIGIWVRRLWSIDF